MELPINYLAVLGSAVAAIVLGFLWFGPLFGRAWMNSMGMNLEEEKARMQSDPTMKRKMMRSYIIMALGALVMAFVFAHALLFAMTYLQSSGIAGGLQGAFWNWLGFVAPVSIGGVLWESKTWKWWFITAGYYLVSLGIMSVILVLWGLP